MQTESDRQVVPCEYIENLVRRKMDTLSGCRQCAVGRVVWKRPEADGCNWTLSRLEGGHCSDCLLELMPLIRLLRINFLVVDPERSAARPRGARRCVTVVPEPHLRFARDSELMVDASRQAARQSRLLMRTLSADLVASRRRMDVVRAALDDSLRLLAGVRPRGSGPARHQTVTTVGTMASEDAPTIVGQRRGFAHDDLNIARKESTNFPEPQIVERAQPVRRT